jgi:hypothetical protein
MAFFDLSLTQATDHNRISYMDILKYPSHPGPRLAKGQLDGDIKTWVEKVKHSSRDNSTFKLMTINPPS